MKFVNETSQTDPKNFYQVGNVIKNGRNIYLVVRDMDCYMLVSLTDNKLVSGINGATYFPTLEELADYFAQTNDKLLTGELKFIVVAHHN